MTFPSSNGLRRSCPNGAISVPLEGQDTSFPALHISPPLTAVGTPPQGWPHWPVTSQLTWAVQCSLKIILRFDYRHPYIPPSNWKIELWICVNSICPDDQVPMQWRPHMRSESFGSHPTVSWSFQPSDTMVLKEIYMYLDLFGIPPHWWNWEDIRRETALAMRALFAIASESGIFCVASRIPRVATICVVRFHETKEWSNGSIWIQFAGIVHQVPIQWRSHIRSESFGSHPTASWSFQPPDAMTLKAI